MSLTRALDPREAEVRDLRRSLSDLVSASALPAMWSGKAPGEIGRTLVEALRGLLDLDLVYLCLNAVGNAAPFEAAAASAHAGAPADPTAIGALLRERFGAQWNATARSTCRTRVGAIDLSLATMRLGLASELGALLAASRRSGFPNEQETLILNVVVNQATIALHEARLLGEHRHLAQRLDERVAQRTQELLDANRALEAEIGERHRAESALRTSESNLRAAIDDNPGLIASLRPDGSIESVNRRVLEYCGLDASELNNWDANGAIHGDDLFYVAETLASSIHSGEPYSMEHRFRRHDGAYRWFVNRGVPVRDEGGRVVRWFGLLTDIDDRKRAEERLASSERSFRQTFNAIPVMAWCMRTDGSNEFLNQRWHDYTGLTPEEANGWGWQVTIHPDDLPALLDVWRDMLATGKGGEQEARLRRHDGAYRWFLFRCDPLRDASGEIVKWYGTNSDIDDTKRADALLAGEKRLLEMIASGQSPLRSVLSALCQVVEAEAPDCYCDIHTIDWAGPTIEYSVAPSLPASYTEPLAGTPLRDDIVPCSIAARQKIQVVAEDFDADPRWCSSPAREHVRQHGLKAVWSTPVCSRGGGVLATLCIYRREAAAPLPHHQDIIARASHIASIAIERLRAEETLRRNETSLADGQRISLTGSFSWQVDTDQLAFSKQLRRIFEFDDDGAVSFEQIFERVYPDDVSILSDKLADVRNGQGNPQFEIRLRMPDGGIKFVTVFGRTVSDESGRFECIGAVQDVTARRLTENALDKVRSDLAHVTRAMSLSTLTASIAHEVNQPLSGIITNANTCLRMLAADPPNIEGAVETARRTIRDGNRASEVITRLRALFSKKEFATESMDLNQAAQEVVALCWHDLQRRGVTIQVKLDETLPMVVGDRVQLQQVILNLLLNAADAMADVNGPLRQIMLETHTEDGAQVRLSVRDSGIGLSDDDLGKIFEPFYTTKSGGMGIGLSVSRSILDRHQGRLWAESNEGPGATFSFSLPLSPAMDADRAAATPGRKP